MSIWGCPYDRCPYDRCPYNECPSDKCPNENVCISSYQDDDKCNPQSDLFWLDLKFQ